MRRVLLIAALALGAGQTFGATLASPSPSRGIALWGADYTTSKTQQGAWSEGNFETSGTARVNGALTVTGGINGTITTATKSLATDSASTAGVATALSSSGTYQAARLGLGVAPGNALDVLGTTDTCARMRGASGGGVYFGAYDANYGALWGAGTTPTLTNYALYFGVSRTGLNAPSGKPIEFDIAGSAKGWLNSSGNFVFKSVNSEPTALAKLHVFGTGNNGTTASFLCQNSDTVDTFRVWNDGNSDTSGTARANAVESSTTVIWGGGGGWGKLTKDSAGPLVESTSGSLALKAKANTHISAILGDAAGVYEYQFMDSGGVVKAAMDSDGNSWQAGDFHTSGSATVVGRVTLRADVVSSGTTPTVTGGVDVSSASVVGDANSGIVTLTMDANAVDDTLADGVLFTLIYPAAFPKPAVYQVRPASGQAAQLDNTTVMYADCGTTSFTCRLGAASSGALVGGATLKVSYIGNGH